MIRFRVLAHALAAAATLAVCAGAGAQPVAQTFDPGAGGPMPADCPPGEPQRSPPKYPRGYFTASGTTVLVLDLDRCGLIDQVWIERNSGYAELDRAAVEAARQWRFSPEIRQGRAVPSRVRLPLDFQPLAPEQVAKSRERVQAEWDRARANARDAQRPLQKDGTLPGYLPDPYPMPAGSAQELIRMVRSEGQRIPGDSPQVPVYTTSSDRGLLVWLVLEEGMSFSPAIIRRRLVEDGEKSYFLSAGTCSAARASDCDDFRKFLELMMAQHPRPPLPRELPAEPPLPPREPIRTSPVGRSRLPMPALADPPSPARKGAGPLPPPPPPPPEPHDATPAVPAWQRD